MAETKHPASSTPETQTRPEYEVPCITTYTDEEILEELGPAQAGPVPGDSTLG